MIYKYIWEEVFSDSNWVFKSVLYAFNFPSTHAQMKPRLQSFLRRSPVQEVETPYYCMMLPPSVIVRPNSFVAFNFWLIGLKMQWAYLIINHRLCTICGHIQMEHMEIYPTLPTPTHPYPYLPPPTPTPIYPTYPTSTYPHPPLPLPTPTHPYPYLSYPYPPLPLPTSTHPTPTYPYPYWPTPTPTLTHPYYYHYPNQMNPGYKGLKEIWLDFIKIRSRMCSFNTSIGLLPLNLIISSNETGL